ncbi:putative calcium-transporting ATPase 13, plasma membrane-type [Impatiens glandulifera]|uniref:putative calcium-transporting ATPase 13, plasma membrane-type n=1 Tax=Impatiens glandulifera TaxID=253017 RepID=UPI001FB118E9|nr:putative calcium-transporting ATPase 13, plasma membrane-type [Impatiens glandulifera]
MNSDMIPTNTVSAWIDSDVHSGSNGGGGGGESLHAGLLDSANHAEFILPISICAPAVRSRWFKVNVGFRFLHTLKHPLSSSYIAVSQVDPENEGVTVINIQDEESVIADADNNEATGPSSPNNQATHTIARRTRSLVKNIMNDEDLNSLINSGSDQFVASIFNSDLESGLGLEGLQEVLTTMKSSDRSVKSLASYFIDEAKSWDIVLLVIAGVLSLVLGMFDVGPHSGWHDSLAIFLVILLLITVPSLTKFREAKKLEKKLHKEEEKVGVIRDGRRQEIAASSVVEGDQVILVEGIRVPGDGFLVGGTDDGLDFDVRPNKPSLRYGYKVVCGTGQMMVTSIGCDTKMGKLMSEVNYDLNAPTCLQSWILGPMSYMDRLSLCISIFVIIGIFIHFRHKNHDKSLPEMKGKPPVENLMSLFMRSLLRPRGLVRFLVTALSTLVTVYQQGVSLAISLALSYWIDKIKSIRNDDGHVSHPQNLSACATMGFVNAVCFDISGETVLQTMEIGKFFVGDKEFGLREESYHSFRLLLQQNGVNINKDLRSPIDSLIEPLLQPMMGEESRVNKSFADKISKSNSGKEILLIKHGQDILHWRGPAKRILDRCSWYSKLDDGTSVQMSPNQRIKVDEIIAKMEDDCFHPIALAYKQTVDQELRQCDLILLAILGVKFKDEAISTLEALKNEGVIIKIISEDRLDEVKSILDQPLISGSKFIFIEGEVFPEENLTTEIMVMDKFMALDKLKMVQHLKQEGYIVAFYGGGQSCFDAPSLREADVGLIIEPGSTEVTKEVTDVVIDGGISLSAFGILLSLCRGISSNLQKFNELQLIVCVSGLIINSVSSLALGESTMTTIQVIWANLVICFLGGLMMRIRFPNCEMNKASDRRLGSRTNQLTKGMWMNFVIQVLYQVSVLMFFLFEKHITKLLGINQDVKNTFVFNSFILCQVVNVLNTIQLDKKEVFHITMKCYTFSATLVTILVVQVSLVQFVSCLTNFHKLNCVQWVECFIVALLPWVCRLILKSLSNHGALFVTSFHRCYSPYSLDTRFTRYFNTVAS